MSFYINNNNQCRPGPHTGNMNSGICEKALLEVTKVFDECRSITTDASYTVTLTDFDPAGPTLPLTFISASSDPTTPATVSNVVIDRIDTRPNFANVSATVTVPIVVSYRDANGVLGTADATITETRNVVLFVPQPSITPVEITAFGAFSSTIGTISADGTTATITGCLQIILKVVATVDILVPSYGYPVIPPCQQTQSTVCPGIADLPLFPTAVSNTNT